MKAQKLMRWAAVLGVGGVLVQATGCATTLAPLALSLLENIVLTSLFGGLGAAI